MRQIIDMHVHAYEGEGSGTTSYFGKGWKNPLTGQTLKASQGPEEHLKETFAAFDSLGIVKAVVSPGTRQGVQAFREHDPARVLIGHNVDLHDMDSARSAHAGAALDVLGEITLQYEGVAPDDPRVDAIFALAEELNVPIGYHLYPGGPPGRAALGMSRLRAAHGNPLLFENALQSYPSVRLYLMHAAWPMLSELLALLYGYPNVLVDIGVIAWVQPRAEFHTYLRRLVEAGYTERIMFGSDQMVWPETIAISVEAVEEAPFLSELQKQAIFYDNAAAFLGL